MGGGGGQETPRRREETPTAVTTQPRRFWRTGPVDGDNETFDQDPGSTYDKSTMRTRTPPSLHVLLAGAVIGLSWPAATDALAEPGTESSAAPPAIVAESSSSRLVTRDVDQVAPREQVKVPCRYSGRASAQIAVEEPVPYASKKLQKCLKACDKGGETFKKFCRALRNPKLKAGCWALQFAEKTACKGWCYWYFDED